MPRKSREQKIVEQVIEERAMSEQALNTKKDLLRERLGLYSNV